MLERDPFGKGSSRKILDTPEKDEYSVERGVKKDSKDPVFGMDPDHAHDREADEALRRKKMRAWVIGGMIVSGVIFVVSAGFGFLWYQNNLFKNERVLFSVEGPDTASGENTEHFIITFENQNRVALQNAVISLRFPENFIPEEKNGLKRDGTTSARVEIGTIAAKQQKQIDVYGYFSGTNESSVFIRAVLKYSPENITGSFQRETQKSVHMDAAIVGIVLNLPIESATGDRAEIAVQYTNRGTETLFSERLKVESPEGFVLEGSDVPPSEGGNVWYLEPLVAGVTRSFKLYGRITGDRGMTKQFTTTIGVLRGDGSFAVHGKAQGKIQIVGSPLSIKMVTNAANIRSVSVGTELSFTLEYSNQGDVGMKNVIVQAVWDGNIFDDSKIKVKDGRYEGSYNPQTKTATWKASDIPDLAFLAPKASGSVVFTLPVRASIPIATITDTHFVGSILASVDSADVPDRIGTRRIVAQDFRQLKLSSDASFSIDFRESSTNASLQDIHFEVGKETELVAYIRLRNTYNDIDDGKLTTGIPSGVTFSGMFPTEGNETVAYEERSHQLIWSVGKIKNATGVLLPDRVIAFRLKVTPQPYQVDQQGVIVLNATEFTGKDSFTGDVIRFAQDKVTVSDVLLKQ